jgi:hypothetical protein
MLFEFSTGQVGRYCLGGRLNNNLYRLNGLEADAYKA